MSQQEKTPRSYPLWVRILSIVLAALVTSGVLTYIGEYNGRKLHAAWNGDYMVTTCWADGKRSLWEIAYRSAVEKNRCSDDGIREEFEFVSDFFGALEEKDYLYWK